jgi:hypothetical protein
MTYTLSAIAEQKFECPQCLLFVPCVTLENDMCLLPAKWSIASENAPYVLVTCTYPAETTNVIILHATIKKNG